MVMSLPCSDWMMKLLTTRPSFGCIRGPNVLKMRATRTSTLAWLSYAYIIVSATRLPSS
jgi:hypothetical protein